MRKFPVQILSSLVKLAQCHVRCNFHHSKPCGVIAKNDTPVYNSGLPGKGKSNKRKVKSASQHVHVHTEGEVLFGIHPVTLALTARLRSHFYTVFIDRKHRDTKSSPSFDHIQDMASKLQIPVQFVSKSTLTQLSRDRPHQGVCLDARPRVLPHCDIQQLIQRVDFNPSLLWLLLYNVQDPMNFGAILRSSYFLGVDCVIVPNVNSCALSPVVSKASAGALEVMDMQQIEGNFRSVCQLTQVWQSNGGQVVGAASEGDCSWPVSHLQNVKVSAPTLLIVGNEGSGIDEDVLNLCDSLLSIPPPHHHQRSTEISSLNVSVATGIMIHWLRMSAVKS